MLNYRERQTFPFRSPCHTSNPVLLTTAEEWDAWLTRSIGEAVALQRPLPNDLLRIVATGEKSDQAPVDESRRRRLHRLSPISNRRRTFLEAGSISEKRHKQNSRARACDHLDGARLLGERWWLRCRPCLPVIGSRPL
jgi:hypothetical protein